MEEIVATNYFDFYALYYLPSYLAIMDEVEYYIEEQAGQQKEVLHYLHQLFLTFPEVQSKLRYGIPFYYRHSWVCYASPRKNGSVELVFIHGKQLSNSQGLLQARDRKMVAGIELTTVDAIPEEALFEIIQEAFLMDEEQAQQKKKK
ncbi:MAG: DUF1801 domain-containing protein [Bacteroidota bacterium]